MNFKRTKVVSGEIGRQAPQNEIDLSSDEREVPPFRWGLRKHTTFFPSSPLVFEFSNLPLVKFLGQAKKLSSTGDPEDCFRSVGEIVLPSHV